MVRKNIPCSLGKTWSMVGREDHPVSSSDRWENRDPISGIWPICALEGERDDQPLLFTTELFVMIIPLKQASEALCTTIDH